MKKSARPNRCTVLASSALGKHLWQFNADDGKTALAANLTLPADKPLPASMGAKSWTTLWQPSVNIAWLTADQVFLRVVQMPQADPSEIGSMLEFQLEKLSPLPVAQIVWSFEIIPSREINNVTVVVIIVERDVVEERVGALEQGGYQPDRLELPHVYQLVAEVPETDGVWVYPWSEGGKDFCVAAWWFTGTMRNLQLVHLPATGDRQAVLREQLLKTAWAGEMEGWLSFPIRWNVVAPTAEIAEWERIFKDWTDGGVATHPQLSPDKLAQFSATRAVRGEAGANLLPPEFSVRYRQVFIDRLWMRGLFTLVGAYLAVVLVYFLAVQWQRVRVANVQRQITNISQSYTNTLKLRERVQILHDQQALKYAALDSLKAASDLLPIEVTLNSLVFGRGQSLELRGTSENAKALADYNDALRKATVAGQPLFKTVSPPTSSARPGAGSLNWQFSCELNRQEVH